MVNTKSIGDITEVEVMRSFMKKGWAISVPWGENSKYDLIADDGENLYRIQCKTGRIQNGVLNFNAHSSHYHRGGKSEGYKGKAEFFGIYCSGNDKVYLVPVEEMPEGVAYLRLTPPLNNQKKGIRYAKTYEV